MQRGKTVVVAGLLAAMVALWGPSAAAMADGVPPPSYGEGAGAPAGVTRGLPDTGSGPADSGPSWPLTAAVGLAAVGLAGVGAWRVSARRRTH